MHAKDGLDGKPPVKILCVCLVGISRSVGLADVLKLHFGPVDVIPVGCSRQAQSTETLKMLCDWADHIVIMTECLIDKLSQRLGLDDVRKHYNIHLCEVGEDIYGGIHRPILIDKVWRWARANAHLLGGIKEVC